MARERVFTQEEIDLIVDKIRTWSGETIKWGDVCTAAKDILGRKPSRQGLSQHEAILTAFQARKGRLRIQPKEASPMPSSLAVASKRIANLMAEKREWELERELFRRKFRTWQYNAHVKGMTEADLDKPLPIIDKDVSESEKDEYGRVK
ncbi:MAG: hypothetical protein Q7U75_11735 [Desulfobacterales bacterium]|nr:hypothetical protein [Desulfobacterales bacterium]